MATETIISILSIIGGLTVAVGIAYIALNRGIVENYKATVESQEKRIEDQDRTIKDLQRRVAHLEGINQGHEMAAELFVRAAARAGICAHADNCDRHAVPTS